jgi:hypothetical protein
MLRLTRLSPLAAITYTTFLLVSTGSMFAAGRHGITKSLEILTVRTTVSPTVINER